jgi:hypothetical protein
MLCFDMNYSDKTQKTDETGRAAVKDSAQTSLSPFKIRVYAKVTTRTAEDHVSPQGFGWSTPLGKPEMSNSYIWEGKLHGQRSDVTTPYNSLGSLEELAQNLALNLKGHQSPQHTQAGAPAYSITFDVEEKEESRQYSKTLVRRLTLVEEMTFNRLLEKAFKDRK